MDKTILLHKKYLHSGRPEIILSTGDQIKWSAPRHSSGSDLFCYLSTLSPTPYQKRQGFKFADDTKLVEPIEETNSVQLLQEDLDSVIKWSIQNNKELREKKFEVLGYPSNGSTIQRFKRTSLFPTSATPRVQSMIIKLQEVTASHLNKLSGTQGRSCQTIKQQTM